MIHLFTELLFAALCVVLILFGIDYLIHSSNNSYYDEDGDEIEEDMFPGLRLYLQSIFQTYTCNIEEEEETNV